MTIDAKLKMEIVEITLHSGKRIDYYTCLTLHALLLGDLKSLHNLLQFGRTIKEYQMALYNSNYLFSCVPKFDFRCQEHLINPDAESSTFNTCYVDDAEISEHLVRKSVVHEVIVFLLKYTTTLDKDVKSSMIKGFRLVWRSRPTPHVRMQELFQVLKEDWIDEECPVRCWRMLQRACNKYSSLFGEISEGVMTPRSLKHLSRCVVREKLMASSWSFGIEKLPIPKHLKSYLLLEF